MLGDFLVNNYKQALCILDGRDALKKAMDDQGISGPEVFEHWLEEERAYLRALAKKPVHETLEMGYYETLAKLQTAEYVIMFLVPLVLFNDIVEKTLLRSVAPGQTIHPLNHHRTCPHL